MRRVGPAIVASLMMLVAGVRADDEVLHEFVPDVDPDEPVRALALSAPAPEAIVYDGEVVDAPELGSSTGPPMVAVGGDGHGREEPGQRSPTYRPDRQTELEGTLGYHAAFSPSIAPFKRVTSLDAVVLGQDQRTPILTIHDPRRRAVAIESADGDPPDARPRDRFWGEAALDFSAGRVVPLPSVSPESRILSLRSEPAIELAIERDGADNYFAVARGRLPEGPVSIVFLTDAPRAYFATALPDVPLSRLAPAVPPLDAGIRERGLRFAAELGLSPSSRLPAALSALTAHFRAFEESAQPPPDTGDIYLDLARGKKGVCRHRAYAFVVTAQALGIPARFVQNEAHSWVEVFLGNGFLRIDLGGAAHGLRAFGASERPPYHPAEPDPLPRPAAYERSYSLLGRNTTGTRKPELSELEGRWVKPSQTGTPQGQSSFLSGTDTEGEADRSGRVPIALTVAERFTNVLRGRELEVKGQARDARGAGVGGLRIEVSLASEGRKERLLLGVAVSDASGSFAGSFGVPQDLATGDYRLFVVTPGDEHHLPALAQ